MAFGRHELPTQVRDEEKAVAIAIYIFISSTRAEFTCCICSAKLTKPTYTGPNAHHRQLEPAD